MIIVEQRPPVPPSWSRESPLAQTRSYAQAVTLVTGEVLIVGGMGRDESGRVVMRTGAVIFHPLANVAIDIGDLGIGRMWHTLTRLADNRVLVAGGVERTVMGYDTLGVAQLYDTRTRGWSNAAPMRHPRSDHAATLLRDGRVLVAGGHYGPLPMAYVEIYNPRTNDWSPVAPLPKTRWSFSMTTLRDGRVLVAGGFEQPGLQTSSTLLYDPVRDSWVEGPRLQWERANHTTVALRSGDLLLIGGQREGAGTAERYDARLGRFVPAGTLANPRMFAQAAERPDGSVVLIGGILRPESGEGFVPNALTEVWDPETNEWTPVQSAPTARAGGTVALVNGAVCIFGGSADGDMPIDAVECYR